MLGSQQLRAKAIPYLALFQYLAHSRYSVNIDKIQHTFVELSLTMAAHADSSLLSTPIACTTQDCS